MAEITVANQDWTIINDVKAALASATIAGQNAFQAVTVTTAPVQARQCQFTTHPAAIVRYAATREFSSPGDVIGCVVDLELILATKTSSPAADESGRVQEALRLVNAVKNAIHATRPAAACDWAGGDTFGAAVEFARAEIDITERQRWCVIRLPASFTFVLASPTSH